MINFDVLTAYIQRALPGANVSVSDRTGTMDHLSGPRDLGFVSGEKLIGSPSDDLPGVG